MTAEILKKTKVQCQKTWKEVQLSELLDGYKKGASEDINHHRYKSNRMEVIMGDKYEAGQAGAMGPNSHAHDMTFNQLWNEAKDQLDLEQLSEQLGKLRTEMSKEAKSVNDFAEIGHVANAEIEAQNGNGSKALSALSNAGKWTLKIAEKISAAVATEAIKKACGF